MLIDLIAAHPTEAEAIVKTVGLETAWQILPAKGIDQVKLSSLALLLDGKALGTTAVVEYGRSFRLLANGGDMGPWVVSVPTDLVNGMAGLQDERISEVAQAWTSTPELKLDRWSAAKGSEFLDELKRFATAARQAKRELLLRVSL